MYTEAFRNTLVVDILEGLGLVKLSTNYVPQEKLQQTATPESSTETSSSSSTCMLRDSENDLPLVCDKVEDAVETAFLVDFNGPDDPENPKNWPVYKKAVVVFQMMFFTTVAYMGSSIYTPGQLEIEAQFGVSHVVATLNLSIFVLGYGIGPIIFSPLSELAKVGRLYLYLSCMALFIIFQIPAALAPNIGGLIVVRFLAGFFSSPAISTGGATMADVVANHLIPYFIGLWALGACAAPVCAPIIGAAMVDAKGWRWIFWLLMMLCALCFVMISFFFPETSHSNILHRKANRVRKETGDDRYYTIGEQEEKSTKVKDFVTLVLLRPFAIIFLEPGVLFVDIFIALVYGTFYLFFEAFPLVFDMYNFTLVETGAAYFGFAVGCFFAYLVLYIFVTKIMKPRLAAGTFYPETFLILAMWVTPVMPVALIMFGWTAGVHWILPIIAEVIYMVGIYNVFQSGFGYLSSNYPRYVASVFAGNAFVRSSVAAGFPLFGKAMYDNLGSEKFPVGWGSTLLGLITLVLAIGPFIIYKYGEQLRGRSRYAN